MRGLRDLTGPKVHLYLQNLGIPSPWVVIKEFWFQKCVSQIERGNFFTVRDIFLNAALGAEKICRISVHGKAMPETSMLGG